MASGKAPDERFASNEQRHARAQSVNHAGEGVPVLEFLRAEALQEKVPDERNPGGPAGEKDGIYFTVFESGTCYDFIYAVGNARKVLRID